MLFRSGVPGAGGRSRFSIGVTFVLRSAPTPVPPSAPGNLVATGLNTSASLAFSSPASNGGALVTQYAATCVAGATTITALAAASPILVTGLTNGVTYSCSVTATNIAGISVPSSSVQVTPVSTPVGGSFTLTSTIGSNGGTLPSDYTCDGMGSTIPLAWTDAPSGTKEFALLMTTLPGDGATKWNWVLYGIPGTITSQIGRAHV